MAKRETKQRAGEQCARIDCFETAEPGGNFCTGHVTNEAEWAALLGL